MLLECLPGAHRLADVAVGDDAADDLVADPLGRDEPLEHSAVLETQLGQELARDVGPQLRRSEQRRVRILELVGDQGNHLVRVAAGDDVRRKPEHVH